ncbi:MAG: S4 domain-containing protein, partial [Pyrinomonadaceae bacterium]
SRACHGLRLKTFMRLDQFLRASRIVVRRTSAQELCEAGAVSVGGAAARSSRTVRVGDEITVRRRASALTVRVLTVPQTKQVSRADAPSLYEVVSDVEIGDEE